MNELISAFVENEFFRNALLAGLLTSIACGVVGALTVVNRLGYAAGGIAHSSLGGIGAAILFGFSPMSGALVTSLIGALIVGTITLRKKENTDTAISAVWATGMAFGILFIFLADGYAVDPSTFLFGNILLVPRSDLMMVGILDVAVLLTVALLFRPLLISSFDKELATTRGLPVPLLHMVIMILLAFTITALIQVVGLLMMIALLTLPAAIARRFTRSLRTMMILGAAIGAFCTTFGLALSWWGDLPSGAMIILLCSTVYFVTLAAPDRISSGA